MGQPPRGCWAARHRHEARCCAARTAGPFNQATGWGAGDPAGREAGRTVQEHLADGHHVDDAADCLSERRLSPTGLRIPGLGLPVAPCAWRSGTAPPVGWFRLRTPQQTCKALICIYLHIERRRREVFRAQFTSRLHWTRLAFRGFRGRADVTVRSSRYGATAERRRAGARRAQQRHLRCRDVAVVVAALYRRDHVGTGQFAPAPRPSIGTATPRCRPAARRRCERTPPARFEPAEEIIDTEPSRRCWRACATAARATPSKGVSSPAVWSS